MLTYQAQVRGHTTKTIEKYKIGLIKKGYIKAARDAGFSFDELLAASVVRKSGRGFSHYLPENVFIYPHFAPDGDVLFFTIKDPAKQIKYQPKKAAADPEWICYGMDSTSTGDPLWIVEGENDRITLESRGGVRAIATIGNFNPSAVEVYLQNLVAENKERLFYLCFDPDAAGKKYTQRFGAAIAGAGGRAFAVDLAAAGYETDIDEILRAANDPERIVAELARKATTVSATEDSNGHSGPWYAFKSFEVLGELADESIAFWSITNRKTYFVDIPSLTLDKLCQIGGREVADNVSRTVRPDKIPFKALKKHLIVEAAARQLGDLHMIGQGVHALKSGRLLVVNGSEAYVYDGRGFAPHDHPLIERRLIDWKPGGQWTDMKAVAEMTLAMDKLKAEAIFDELANLINQWEFAGSMDVILVTGFFLAQIVQMIWDWRPHMWISGSQGSGKTLLTLLLEAIGGGLVLRSEGNGLTEAGLRQSIQHHSWVTIIDEFEKSEARDKIIEMLRSAGRGGVARKGTVGQQGAISYQIKFSALICSIETGLVRAAEKFRYLIVNTAKRHDVDPSIPSASRCAELQIKSIAYALWAVGNAKRAVREMGRIPGYDNRWVESIAVPLSMMAVITDNPPAFLASQVSQYITEWEKESDGGMEEDEQAALLDIMLAKIKLPLMSEPQEAFGSDKPIYTDRTVAQLLSDPYADETTDKVLQAYGIRRKNDRIMIHPETVTSRLLGRSRWRNLNLRDILARLPGAEHTRAYIASTQARVISVPVEICLIGDSN